MKFLNNETTYKGIQVSRTLRKRRAYLYKATFSMSKYHETIQNILLTLVKNGFMSHKEGDYIYFLGMTETRIKQIITFIHNAIETSNASER